MSRGQPRPFLYCRRTAGVLALAAAASLGQQGESSSELVRLTEQVRALEAAGDVDGAIESGERLVALQRDARAEDTESLARTLAWIARLERRAARWDEARAMLLEARGIWSDRMGEDHYQTREVDRTLAGLECWAALEVSDRDSLRSLHDEVDRFYRTGRYKEAIECMERALALERELMGERDPDHSERLNNLGVLYRRAGRFAEAEECYRRAIEMGRDVLGERDPWFATRLSNLAILYQDLGRYREADELLRQALDIQTATLGPDDSEVGRTLASLGSVLRAMGRLRAAEPPLSEALRIRVARLGREHRDSARSLQELARLYQEMGLLTRAEALQREATDILARTMGTDHPVHAVALNNLGLILKALDRHAEAERCIEGALAIKRDRLGEKHPSFAATLALVGSLHGVMGDLDRAEEEIARAAAILRARFGAGNDQYANTARMLADVLVRRGEYHRAESLLQEVLTAYESSLGTEAPRYATALAALGGLYVTMGDLAKAEGVLERAARSRASSVGAADPVRAGVLLELAEVLAERGDYGGARRNQTEALGILEKAYGHEHLHVATALIQIARLSAAWGRFAEADGRYREAAAILREVVGTGHVRYGVCLAGQGSLHASQGDVATAERLLRESLDVFTRGLGEDHPDTAAVLHDLANLLGDSGRATEAEPLMRRTLEILRARLGVAHARYGRALNDLGVLQRRLGRTEDAEAIYREALGILAASPGKRSAPYAIGLLNLALIEIRRGLLDPGIGRLRESLALRREFYGPDHPQCAACLAVLGSALVLAGREAEAIPCIEESLRIRRAHLETCSAAQSERQQIDMAERFRGALDGLLRVPPDRGPDPQTVYSHVLAWKGAVHARQRRLHVAARNPELADAFTELESVAGRLATLALATPDPARRQAWLEEVRAYTDRKEELERELRRRSTAMRRAQETAAPTSATLLDALPPGTAVVDFVVYADLRLREEGGALALEEVPRLVAFVGRPGGTLRRVELGGLGPVIEALDEWRGTLAASAGGSATVAARRMAELVWKPLEPDLTDAGTVLVSPDGPLARLPFAALPGSSPDRYLLEERNIVILPVPSLFPDLLAPAPVTGAECLLGVGDVDYGPAETSSPFAGVEAYAPLPGTAGEIAAIRATFRKSRPEAAITLLSGSDARENAFLSAAPGHRWIHVATHGYFAAPRAVRLLGPVDPESEARMGFGQEGLAGLHPGLLSGLVFAGANSGGAADAVDDGILTALEAAALDLSGTELVTLSACETGLGSVRIGEGVLGLQRAFQIAGARTTVTSLWSIPDEATHALMARFYSNLWERALPRGEALREAQLWMLREGAGEQGAMRGVAIPGRPRAEEGTPRLPPLYWAGFVLSGDWR